MHPIENKKELATKDANRNFLILNRLIKRAGMYIGLADMMLLIRGWTDGNGNESFPGTLPCC